MTTGSSSEEEQALAHLARAQEKAAQVDGLDPAAQPKPIGSVAILGSGTMGGGIAMVMANAGLPVILLDVDEQALMRGLERVRGNYGTSLKRGSTTQEKVDAALARIVPATDYEAIRNCDIVIEAVFENLDLKREIFARLDALMKPGAVLASNTSALDLDAIAASTSRPQDVIGLHFFSPANVMKLIEVVRGKLSSDVTIATAMAFATQVGKVPVLAGNCDGFIGNRILRTYGSEADFLLEDGATPWQIDNALKAFGFPMGVYLMRDLAGLDVGWRSRLSRNAAEVAKANGTRYAPLADRLCEQERFGQKTGAGYYRYVGRDASPDPEVETLLEAISAEKGIKRRGFTDAEIVERILSALVNEAARVVEEGIAQRAGDIDVTYAFGYGFPKARGGPMYWAERHGLDNVLALVRRLHGEQGDRWKPAPLLERLAAAGKGWGA